MGNKLGMLQCEDAWWGTQKVPKREEGYHHKQYPKPIEITHDPMDGFPNGRKPRVAHASHEEMVSARIDKRRRDYCAHKLIAFKNCRYLKYPFVYRCAHERHEWESCEFDDHVLRLKEAERERRLRERDAARAAAQVSA